jgi:hypothetical protein
MRADGHTPEWDDAQLVGHDRTRGVGAAIRPIDDAKKWVVIVADHA